jgi:hypothetical protein
MLHFASSASCLMEMCSRRSATIQVIDEIEERIWNRSVYWPEEKSSLDSSKRLVLFCLDCLADKAWYCEVHSPIHSLIVDTTTIRIALLYRNINP